MPKKCPKSIYRPYLDMVVIVLASRQIKACKRYI